MICFFSQSFGVLRSNAILSVEHALNKHSYSDDVYCEVILEPLRRLRYKFYKLLDTRINIFVPFQFQTAILN
jgi:hypothetical protein